MTRYHREVTTGSSTGPGCLSDAEVAAFVGGELSPAARAEAEAHLDTCPICLNLVAALGRAETRETPEDPERYTISREVGAGGMGQVFEAYDAVLGRNVALKCVLRGADDHAVTRRFEREMALTARLQHPSIIPVYDAGHFPDGGRYFAMRLVEGSTLDQTLAEANSDEARLALVPSIRRACEAVAYAHDQAVVHRDLKPANVLIGPFGETVVLDWGLAKDLSEPEASSTSVADVPGGDEGQTRPGAVMGTRGYIAPEVARGEPADRRGDVFALGKTLSKMLPASEREVGPRALSEALADLRAIVERATATDPAGRYADAGALCEELRRFEAGQTVEARDYTARTLVARFVRRHRLPVALVAVFLSVSAIAGTWGLSRVLASRERAAQAQLEAERQRELERERRVAAQELVQFIVDDLQVSLRTIGRNDLLRTTAERALTYFEAVEEDDPTDRVQHATVFLSLGDAFSEYGEREKARRAYEAAAEGFAAAPPDGAGTNYDLYVAKDRVSGLLESPEAQRSAMLEVAAVCEAELAKAPGTVQWLELVGPLLGRLYMLEEALGNYDAATAALDRLDALIAAPSEPSDAWKDIAAKHRFGALHHRTKDAERIGDTERQNELAEELVALARHYASSEPDDIAAVGLLGSALLELGFARHRAKDLPGAQKAWAEGVEVIEERLKKSPDSNTQRLMLAKLLLPLARNHRRLREHDKAVAVLHRAEEVALQIDRTQPNDPNVLRQFLGQARLNLCGAEFDRGRPKAALEACERAFDPLTRAASLAPMNKWRFQDEATLNAYAARAALAIGERKRAREYADAAKPIVTGLRAMGSGDAADQLDTILETIP